MEPERESTSRPLAAAWRLRLPICSQRPPVEDFDAEAVSFKRTSQGLGELNDIAGTSGVLEPGGDPLLAPWRARGIGRLGRHRGAQPDAGASELQGHSPSTELEGIVLAAQPGVGGRHRICLAICLIVVEPGHFCLMGTSNNQQIAEVLQT